jgi:hypothetical protein
VLAAYRLSRAAADDHDRAGRVFGALLADRADQQVGEASVVVVIKTSGFITTDPR